MRSNLIAYLALFVALGGSAYAASKINGKLIEKRSIPGNRLKQNAVTGRQVRESTLSQVPSAETAANAQNATHAQTAVEAQNSFNAQNSLSAQNASNAGRATNADNADALGNTPPSGFGQGIVNGGIDSPSNGASFRTPYGVTGKLAPGAALEAIAPVAITLRDFEGRWITNFDSDDTLTFAVQINNGSSLISVPLCTIVGTAEQMDCRAGGPVPIAQGDLYRLELTGTGLEENEQASFAYRIPAR